MEVKIRKDKHLAINVINVHVTKVSDAENVHEVINLRQRKALLSFLDGYVDPDSYAGRHIVQFNRRIKNVPRAAIY